MRVRQTLIRDAIMANGSSFTGKNVRATSTMTGQQQAGPWGATVIVESSSHHLGLALPTLTVTRLLFDSGLDSYTPGEQGDKLGLTSCSV